MARFFVNRPIVAIVLSIIMVMLGTVAMSGLPIAQYPEIVPPMVQVTTTFIGASATDVEASVASPLEQQINGVEQMIYMKSTNANDGTLTLKVSFEVGSNLDMVTAVRNSVAQLRTGLAESVRMASAYPAAFLGLADTYGKIGKDYAADLVVLGDALQVRETWIGGKRVFVN